MASGPKYTQLQCNTILTIYVHADIKELGPDRLVQTTQDQPLNVF
jgi:hypothetical protein